MLKDFFCQVCKKLIVGSKYYDKENKEFECMDCYDSENSLIK